MSLPQKVRRHYPIITDDSELFRTHISRALDTIEKRLARIEALTLLRTYEPQKYLSDRSGMPSASEEKVAFTLEDGIMFLRPSEIIRCQADSNYCWIYMKNGARFLQSHTLKEVEQQLPSEQFLRTHKSHLVNLGHIRQYQRRRGIYLAMEDGSKVPVARQRRELVLRKIFPHAK